MRPAKRLKSSDEPTTPSALPNNPKLGSAVATRSSQRRLGNSGLTYGSSKKSRSLDELRQKFVLNGESDDHDLAKSFNVDATFHDSAYASLSASYEDANEQDRMSMDITPLSHKSERPRGGRTDHAEAQGPTDQADDIASPSKRTKRNRSIDSVSTGDVISTTISIKVPRVRVDEEHGEEQSANVRALDSASKVSGGLEAHTRSSGRSRTKSRRLEDSDTIELVARPVFTKRTPVKSTGLTARRSKQDLRATPQTTLADDILPANVGTPDSARKRGRPKGSKNRIPAREHPTPFEFKDILTGKGRTPACKVPRTIIEEHAHPETDSEASGPAPVTPSKRIRKEVGPRTAISGLMTEPEAIPMSSAVQEKAVQASLEQLVKLLESPEYADAYVTLRDQISHALAGKRRFPLVGLDLEYAKIYQLVEQTVVAGEGNSMLIIGARGSGKSTVVESVLEKLVSQHSEDFHVVRLNGFLHTDDKLALKEIWRQLGKEMDMEDEMTGRSNYADTLASLLALLSHPSEFSDQNAQQTSKSVVFIMDEFELFASHPRQTLLYNLFDIAQSRKAPIAVLGLTAKIDVVESLEKRVKSRFSHRYVHLSLPKNYPAFLTICKAALHCNLAITSDPQIAPDSSLSGSNEVHRKLLIAWTSYIDAILVSEPLSTHIHRLYYQTKSIPTFLTSALLPILFSTPANLPKVGDFLTKFHALESPDSKLPLLRGLADVELAVLISAARLDIILDADACNFNMAYEEYLALTSRARITSGASGTAALSGVAGRVWGREIALGAWERLGDIGLLVPVTGAGSSGAGAGTDLGRRGRLWKVDVALEELGASGLELGGMSRWTKEITL